MDLANQNNLEVPSLGVDEQLLLEQVCTNLELPWSRLRPADQTQPEIPSWQGPPDAFLQSDQIPATLQYQADSSVLPIHGGSATSVSCGTDPNAGFDIPDWTDFGGSSIWDGSPTDWPWQVLNDFSVFPTFITNQSSSSFQPGNTFQTEGLRSSPASDDEGEEGVIPCLAARLGSLRRASDGRLRYYGTASNHHFLKNFGQHEKQIDIEDLEDVASTALENAQLDHEIPLSLENHLIELFFAWHNPCHGTVDRLMFETARAHHSEGQSDFSSPSLISTM